jgi:phage regulator Rha-like protein
MDMKNNMQMLNATLTSLEVAKMMEKRHDNLVRDIQKYSKYIEESNNFLGLVKNDESSEEEKFNALKIEVVKNNQRKNARVEDGFIDSTEFWTDSTYLDGKGESRPYYNITKKGCEFIAHKCTGRKGTVFTARYINRFHEMEHEITGKRLETKGKVPNVANCPAPPAKNWYRKNLWKIKPCAIKMYCSVEEFLDFLFEYLNNFFDTLTAKEIYEEQTGNKLEKDVDLLDFFPDMGERAQEILNFTYSYKMDK